MSSEGQKDLHELSASILKKNNDATVLREDACRRGLGLRNFSKRVGQKRGHRPRLQQKVSSGIELGEGQ